FGEKRRRLAEAKVNLCTAALVQRPQEILISCCCEVGVELLAELGDHSLSFDQEFSRTHDLEIIDPDVEFRSDHVNMGGGIPLRAGMFAVRVSEGDMNAGELFILQDVA